MEINNRQRLNPFLALSIFMFVAFGCKEQAQPTSAFEHIKDEKVKSILKRSINGHGGLDAWQKIKYLSYTKDFALFDGEGKQESFTKQKHNYDFQNNYFEITTESRDVISILKLEKGVFTNIKNGKKTDDSQIKMQKSFNTSMYVLGIPFKLLDKGVDLKYIGTESINNELQVDVIQATYNNKTNPSHSTNDIWWYYFDIEGNHTVIANKVKTHDHDAIVDNLSFMTAGDIKFHGHRKSYRIDSLGKKDYLRAEYFYDNYVVE